MRNHIVTPKTFATYSLGCRTNEAEIQALTRQLSQDGLAFSPQPELIIINSCVVTQKAEHETKKLIRHLRKSRPQSRIAVLGCAATAQEQCRLKLPTVDLLIANQDKKHARQRILDYLKISADKSLSQTWDDKYAGSGRRFVKIQDGCDRSCAFCLTTHLRGQPASQPVEQVIQEVKKAARQGIKEVVLTGVNLALYGQELIPTANLWQLASSIFKQTKIAKLTLSSIYPEMLLKKSPEFWPVVNNPRFCRCFHLTLQSGSTTVLQRMNRPTNITQLAKSLTQIKKQLPDFTYQADIVTGFPNETKQEHEQTLKYLAEIGISFAHVFPFSTRPGTKAEQMIKNEQWSDLPRKVKKERAKEVTALVAQIRERKAKKLLGRVYQTLVIRKRTPDWEGITENNWGVKILNANCEIPKTLKGELVATKITGYHQAGYLWGEITSLPR